MPRRKKPTCFYCDQPAEYFCDFMMDDPIEARRDAMREGLDPETVEVPTCDRPLCEAHRTHKGTKFFCGKAGWIETEDFCPQHAPFPMRFRPRYNPVGNAPNRA